MTKTTKTAKTAPKLPGAEFDKPVPKGATQKQIDAQYRKELQAERAALGQTHIPASKAQLARGIGGRDAPHSAKAVADGKAQEKEAAKAKPAVAKKEARKAERAAKAAPKADDNRKITVVDKKFTYGREGTARRASWDACTKSKTVADYAAAGGALKYLPRWTAAGAIKLV
jgi:hypothetical protein